VRAVVAFHSSEFDLSWSDDGPDLNAPPLGQDCAKFILDALASSGVTFDPPEAIQDECGWVLYAQWQAMSFSLFVHWAPLKSFAGDWWVVQVARRSGVIRSLFGRPTEDGVAEFCDLLATVLSSVPEISDIRWFGREEFAKEY
jgi:hypothetical protein